MICISEQENKEPFAIILSQRASHDSFGFSIRTDLQNQKTNKQTNKQKSPVTFSVVHVKPGLSGYNFDHKSVYSGEMLLFSVSVMLKSPFASQKSGKKKFFFPLPTTKWNSVPRPIVSETTANCFARVGAFPRDSKWHVEMTPFSNWRDNSIRPIDEGRVVSMIFGFNDR